MVAPMVAASIASPIVGGLLGGKGSREQARAANRPRTTTTNQTTTNLPFDAANPLIDALGPAILENFQRGPSQVPRFRYGNQETSRGVLDRLLNFNPSSTDSLQGFVDNTLGGGGQNEISSRLSERLFGQDTGRSSQLIEQFLRGGNLFDQRQEPDAGDRPHSVFPGGFGGGGGFSFTGTGGGGSIPDTLAGPGTVADAIRGFLDPARLDPANDPTVQPVLDMLRRNATAAFQDILNPLEQRVQGLGRIGSDFHGSVVADAAGQGQQGLADAEATQLFGARQGAIDAALNALGIGNARDIAAGQIGASDRATQASASSAASGRALQAELERDRLDLERQLGLRGQDLSAILGLQGSEDSRLGLLGGLSGSLDDLRLGAGQLGLGLGGLELDPLLSAAGVAGGIDSRALDAARSRFDAGLARSGAGDRSLDDFLRRTMALAGLGGTSTTQGTNVVPGAGVSTKGAGALGALGGASTGLGALGAFGSLMGPGGGG